MNPAGSHHDRRIFNHYNFVVISRGSSEEHSIGDTWFIGGFHSFVQFEIAVILSSVRIHFLTEI